MSNFVDRLLTGKNLGIRECKKAFLHLFLSADTHSADWKQFLVLLEKKGICPDELVGLIRAVRQIEKPILTKKIPFLVDGCGTGGDGAGTINISTLACFVAAAAGASIAKHGNRSISSKCGSADLLKALGVRIDAPTNRMIEALKACRFGYFHAPLYHPVFQKVQPIRQELASKKIKTIFNLIGPLASPLRPKCQAIGISRREFLPVLAHAIKQLGYQHVIIFWNEGGTDELTTCHSSQMAEVHGRQIVFYRLNPALYGFKHGRFSELKGGNLQYNKRAALRILKRTDRSARTDTVLLNAGAILCAAGKTKSIREGIARAKQALERREAYQTLQRLIKISHGLK